MTFDQMAATCLQGLESHRTELGTAFMAILVVVLIIVGVHLIMTHVLGMEWSKEGEEDDD